MIIPVYSRRIFQGCQLNWGYPLPQPVGQWRTFWILIQWATVVVVEMEETGEQVGDRKTMPQARQDNDLPQQATGITVVLTKPTNKATRR